jgi:uracil phosphoribosyltransferase
MLKVCNHPLIEVKLNHMRDENTRPKEFREALDEIASLMTYEVFKDLEVVDYDTTITTPTGAVLPKKKIKENLIIAPILRAGLGMVEGVRNMVPTARIGHIGLYRDEETLEPQEYYFKLPEINNPLVLICDPMLATGGSAIAAINAVKKRGYNKIRLMCLVGVPEGISAVQKAHPDVDIYIAAVDDHLNEKGYILPGLGDAGDRIFGTK